MLSAKKRKPRKVTPKPAEPSAASETQYASRAVAKAFALLNTLSGSDQHLTLSQLADSVQLTKSSTLRLLHTLQTLGQVKQNDDGRYTNAHEDRAGRYAQLTSTLIPLARGPMQEMQKRFKETLSLAVLFANHIEVVDVLESPHIVRMANTVGRILPPHASSLGKAITAFQPAEVAKQLMISYGLPRFTPATLIEEDELVRGMEIIRGRGYATENEESVADGCCFGVPICIEPNVAVAAMSVSMPKSRSLAEPEREQLTDALREASAGISKRLRQAMRSTA